MSSRGPFDPNAARMYGSVDRQEQLGRLERACDQLAQLYESRDAHEAATYRRVAAEARAAGESETAHPEIKAFVARVPARPAWLDPRNPGYDMDRDEWFEAVSRARSDVDRVVLELRALGTYD